jgi:hypothetical protein
MAMPPKPVCRITHPQVASGSCPWCGVELSPSETPGGRTWDLAKMRADLDHEDHTVRRLTVDNVRLHVTGLQEAVTLLGEALGNSSEPVADQAAGALAMLGTRLTAEEAQRYEDLSRQDPGNLAYRVLLLGGYGQSQFHSGSARRFRQDHVLWVIEHAPRSDITGKPFSSLNPSSDGEAYAEAKRLWLGQVKNHPGDTKVLGNAAGFFTIHDKVLSGELYRKARSLEPDKPEWSQRLGHLYSLELTRKEPHARRDWAAMSLAELERAHAMDTDRGKGRWVHCQLAKAAFEAGDHPKARAYAQELVTTPGDSRGDAVHIGNLVLGRLALAAGDVDAAKSHLIESANTPGSPVLGSFGPSMTLAKELLDRGEREAVLRYLELCSKFWKMGVQRGVLPGWIEEVRRGGCPDFGPSTM